MFPTRCSSSRCDVVGLYLAPPANAAVFAVIKYEA
jgi:hypothetical protein